MKQINRLIRSLIVFISSIGGIVILIVIFSSSIMGLRLGPLISPGGVFNSAYGSLYQDKTFTSITGIDNTVIIIRDNWGIPHIYGKTQKDVLFALGYCHATDRMFQMDITIRTGMGLMSEILGEGSLEDDIYFQTLGIGKAAQEMLDLFEYERQTNPELDNMLNLLDAYIEGINFEINRRIITKTLPIEFQLLGYQPSLWSPLKTFVYNRLMSLMLTYSTDDLDRTILRDSNLFNGNETAMEELFPINNTYYQIPVIPTFGNYSSPFVTSKIIGSQSSEVVVEVIGTRKELLTKALENIPKSIAYFQQSWIGSNNWVVNGSKTTTGKPILANDMHLRITLPHIWYEAHMIVEDIDLNIFGYTLTGTPVVIVGFNSNIAWGMTNVGNDAVDWYEYVWNGEQYWSGKENTWKTPEERIISIPVKGKANHTEIVKYTEDGVVMAEIKGKTMLAMRWTATEEPTNEIMALVGVNRAHNWVEFNESMQFFQDPTQNIVFADQDGNIALRPTGRFIKRSYFGEGRFVINGSDPLINKDWEFIPYNELPLALNPNQKYLASANQKSTGPDYKYYISSVQDDGYRARSINKHLNEATDGSIDVEFMKDAQAGNMGVYDTFAEAFTPYIINAVESSGQVTSGSLPNEVLNALKSWQISSDKWLVKKELIGPTVLYQTMLRFKSYVWDDEWEAAELTVTKPDNNVLEFYVKNSPNAKWFDDITTSGTLETRDQIFVKAFLQAVNDLKDELGEDSNEWLWGNYHHMNFNSLAGISAFGKENYQLDGSGNTLLNAEGRIVTGGPSQRMVIDFSNISNSWSVLPAGVSGNPASSHYADQALDLWIKGLYHRMLIEYKTILEFPKKYQEAVITFKPL